MTEEQRLKRNARQRRYNATTKRKHYVAEYNRRNRERLNEQARQRRRKKDPEQLRAIESKRNATAKRRAYVRTYALKNRTRLSEIALSHYNRHREKILLNNWARREEINMRVRAWRQKNADILHEKRRNNSNVRLKQNIGRRLRKLIGGAARKSAATEILVGCTISELRNHLESQFRPGMTWNSYGVKGWHIDHIRPCDDFDLTDPAQQRACFHYSNLQPLFWWENHEKSNKLDWKRAA